MNLADRICADIMEEVRAFSRWLAKNWTMDPNDSAPTGKIPTDPHQAFCEGWNRCCASMADAFDLYDESDL